ncbi:hypothetical protein K2173_012466 [Erythroxylum novogranatense]|uniref:PCI domain-containing protein n=1 Tax=Erythroxylum novogranatense TaxID=1862640 RepID=A0AAV8U502_9ROSI|nr:hypothetical protein K2173_012466 [Erythroxylum novogranatense]
MELEKQQADLVQELTKRAESLHDSSLANFILEATSHPSLYSFSDFLALPNVIQLGETEYSVYVSLLRLFAYGTWHDYRRYSAGLPKLSEHQILKLKQLSLITFAGLNKTLSYYGLMKELELPSVRELEDFLIECIYLGIVKGKLNQFKRCFKVEFAAGRDVMPGQLPSMIESAETWFATSDDLLSLVQEKIDLVDMESQLEKNHQMEFKDKIENLIKHVSAVKSSLQRDNIWTSVYSCIESDIATIDGEELVQTQEGVVPPVKLAFCVYQFKSLAYELQFSDCFTLVTQKLTNHEW